MAVPGCRPFWFSFTTPLLFCTLLLHNIGIIFSDGVLVGLRRNHGGRNTRTWLQANSSCDLFAGSWVRDESYPLYQYTCPAIDPEFNCLLYGRPDTDYLKYRWQPASCQIPRFDGADFVDRMRGKRIMFVGDSLGRNQWESLICMISSGLPSSSSTQFIAGDPLSSFKFLDYGMTVSFYRAPYLVDVTAVQGKRVLKLDEIGGNGKAWTGGYDVLSFNTGHWWSHTGNLRGWDYMEAGGRQLQDMERTNAMELGMRTWANWVDNNVDSRTKVFFQGISPSHYNPSEWSWEMPASRSCYGERRPSSGYPGTSVNQVKVVQEVLSSMRRPPFLLDISLLSAMRKDAHPSIYSGDLSPEQRANPDRAADCSHWCLPGLPDTWNQLFYTALFYFQ